MHRRTLLKAGAGLATLGATGSLLAGGQALEYSPELYQSSLDSGEPFLLDFYASWCGTCRRQERAISKLQSDNDAYAAVKVIKVDWDMYSDSDIAKELNIPRRSTLVMFKDGKETGRVIAQTGDDAIEALFKAVV